MSSAALSIITESSILSTNLVNTKGTHNAVGGSCGDFLDPLFGFTDYPYPQISPADLCCGVFFSNIYEHLEIRGFITFS